MTMWTCVSVVNDYADTDESILLWKKLKTNKKCNLIFSKIVRVVVDYADTSMTKRAVNENFDGFSQILKEQFGRKRYLSVFTHPIAII